MAGVKKRSSPKELNWQNFHGKRSQNVGKKPLPDPTTIKHVFLMIGMHICRKIVLFETELKIAVYLATLVCVSLVCDFAPFPKSYFSRKTNLFNYYFVKWGWGWTLIAVSSFIGLTSWIYCCGNIDRMKKHFYRLLVATVIWFCCVKSFEIVENFTSSCYNEKYKTKISCLRAGSTWKGFDISGHAFLLIFCSLLIGEEAKSIRGWERIGELIRNEEYDEDSPLKSLTDHEKEHLRDNYERFTPYIRLSFFILTYFSILWDVMLICTIIYFHSMVQKVIGGGVAILMWYVTYKYWYKLPNSPGLPGQGIFKYYDEPVAKRTCNHR